MLANWHKENVPHIPEVLGAGDALIDAMPQFCRRDYYQHRRLALGVTGRALPSFTSVNELIRAIYHAFLAHRYALEDADLLHRDISTRNIIIVDNGGLLIHWDLPREAGTAMTTERIGTLQFLSGNIASKRRPLHVHSARDDVESFFHVLTWIIIRCGPSSLPPKTRWRKLSAYDSEGSSAKLGLLSEGSNYINSLAVTHSPLSDLLSTLSELFQYRYLGVLRLYISAERWEEICQETEDHGRIAQLFESWLHTNESSSDLLAEKAHDLEDKRNGGPKPPRKPLDQAPEQGSGRHSDCSEEEKRGMPNNLALSTLPSPTNKHDCAPIPQPSRMSDSGIPTPASSKLSVSQGPTQQSKTRRTVKPQPPQTDQSLLRRSSRLKQKRDEERSLELEKSHMSGSKRKSRGNMKDGGTRGCPAKKRRLT